MNYNVKIPDVFSPKSSLEEYLGDEKNSEFNQLFYDLAKKYYTEEHFDETEEEFNNRMLQVFNRAYQCAIKNVNGHIMPHWGKSVKKNEKAYRIYIMPDGEDLGKYDLLPQVVMPLLYQLLESHYTEEPIGNIRAQILEAFRSEKFFKRLDAKVHGTHIRNIIDYPNADKLLSRIRELIEGKKGADVGCVFNRCLELGYITRVPTRKEFLSEFSIEGCSWTSIHKYMKPNEEDENDFYAAAEKANKVIIFLDEDKERIQSL